MRVFLKSVIASAALGVTLIGCSAKAEDRNASGDIAPASVSDLVDLSIAINGVATNDGDLYIALCTESEYPKTCSRGDSAPAKAGAVQVVIKDVPAASYAVIVYHDENSNAKLDSSAIGIPKEGYGFSGKPGRFGPPSFKAASILVDASATSVDVNLIY